MWRVLRFDLHIGDETVLRGRWLGDTQIRLAPYSPANVHAWLPVSADKRVPETERTFLVMRDGATFDDEWTWVGSLPDQRLVVLEKL